MARGDVSFTFLDRIGEIRRNVRDERWQSALALALTLPDICGGIAYPELVKKYRDGRVMEDRYGNPARDVGNQYILWFDQYAAPFFKKQETDEAPYICGERCWQLRCEYLHQNKGFVNLEAEQEIHFHLGINCGTSICQLDQETDGEGALNIRLDIEQLCLRLSLAAQRFYEEFHETCDFDLYNTPVIDFIQWSGGQERRGKTAAVVCRDEVMAKGLAVALEPAADRVLTFTNPYDPVKRFAKKKPSVWVVTDPFPEKKDPPWTADRETPLLFLGEEGECLEREGKRLQAQKEQGRFGKMKLPPDLRELRRLIKELMGEKEGEE
ncbi:MAG TPA: hypothetical protein IAB28_02820 [Candidatus Copromonas faecavium]|uniref:Uncharacterized protein n=1 Tax=Candidatus Copromonas faecavium (nom. illeg.) TaxID=2840740 RepID=A0A9D1A2L8_9FIRM|nr:hypothetical protein [Candidatus Copromonas faecavium]